MSILEIFNSSALSQAAYANQLNQFNVGASLISQLSKRNDEGGADMTTLQAQYVANNFRVIEQQDTTSSGFSATLFQNIHTNEYHLAMRGTDGNGPDWSGANLDNVVRAISREQSVDMLNFYLRLTGSGDVVQYELQELRSVQPPSQPYYVVDSGSGPVPIPTYAILAEAGVVAGEAVISPATNLAISGHSLGGHLAAEFSLLFPNVVSDTATFNSAGFIGWTTNEVNDFNTVLANTVPQVGNVSPYSVGAFASVTDISAPLDFVSNRASHLGSTQLEVSVESVEDTLPNIAENHSQDRLVDALAVINFLHTLDHSITIESANAILDSAASVSGLSLESVMGHLSRLFSTGSVVVADSDHDSLYSTMNAVTSAQGFLEDAYRIESVSGDVLALAQAGDKAALYSLIHAQPFVVRGSTQAITDSLYTPFNNELDINDYSEEYLQGRAEYLSSLITYNTADGALTDLHADTSTVRVFIDHSGHPSLVSFTGLTTGEPVVVSIDQASTVGVDVSDYPATVFGSSSADNLLGNNQDDSLYGGSGNDTLVGGEGDDDLEGGAGDDVYRFNYGAGRDVVFDVSGSNQLFIEHKEGEGAVLVGTLSLISGSDSIYAEFDEDGSRKNNTTYVLVDAPTAGHCLAVA